jgi:hypothetical protein
MGFCSEADVEEFCRSPPRVHNPDYHRGPVAPELYVPERY